MCTNCHNLQHRIDAIKTCVGLLNRHKDLIESKPGDEVDCCDSTEVALIEAIESAVRYLADRD